jgi:predicted N-acetyltransferase YhbS
VSEPLPAPTIRRARPEEAVQLTELAMRSKAHWGYDAAFMRAAVPDMTIAPEMLEEATAFVAEDGAGEVAGFYVLAVEEEDEEEVPTLRDLWVEPRAIGTGLGAALWRHMIDQARLLGYRTVRIVSEPNAEGFYRKMGARRVGEIASRVVEGRMLPLMEVETV